MTNGLLLHPSSLLGPPPSLAIFPLHPFIQSSVSYTCVVITLASVLHSKQPTATQKISINVGRQTDDGCH